MRLILALALMLASTSPAALYRAGAKPGMTGGFGERDCSLCHFDNDINDPRGSMRIQGLPKSYTPGRVYAISVRITHPDLKCGGFQLSIRVADGAKAGAQAGAIKPVDDRVQIVSPAGRLQRAQNALILCLLF
jgi:hypothetical protein